MYKLVKYLRMQMLTNTNDYNYLRNSDIEKLLNGKLTSYSLNLLFFDSLGLFTTSESSHR